MLENNKHLQQFLKDILNTKYPLNIERCTNNSAKIISFYESVQTIKNSVVIDNNDCNFLPIEVSTNKSYVSFPQCVLSDVFSDFLIKDMCELLDYLENNQVMSCHFSVNGYYDLIFESSLEYKGFILKIVHRCDVEFDDITEEETLTNAISFALIKNEEELFDYDYFGDFKSISELMKRVNKEINKYLIETRN